MRLRMQFAKGEPVRYISHLDLARTFERAIHRAKLPIAMSEGFNPHIKVAYASALSVGVTSNCEYIDIELREDIPAEEAVHALRQQMPEGLELDQYKVMIKNAAALMAIVNMADYTVEVPTQRACEADWVEGQLEQLLAADAVPFIRQSPKGRRELNLRPLIGNITLVSWTADKAIFALRTYITDRGAVKPQEVMQVLAEQYTLPVCSEDARIHRDGLYVRRNDQILSPFDIVK
jgi:radical SAM-linked protein